MVNVVEKIKDTHKKINLLDFDAHWYRRAFHAFGASFLLYYILPDVDWINLLKFWVPPIVVVICEIVNVVYLVPGV